METPLDCPRPHERSKRGRSGLVSCSLLAMCMPVWRNAGHVRQVLVRYLHVSLNSEVTYVGEYAVCDRQLASKEGLFLYSGSWAE